MYEPRIMPARLNSRPISCGSTIMSAPENSSISHVPSPKKIDSVAPRLLARRQNRPAASGTNAPASVMR